jgi:hypothetical protein
VLHVLHTDPNERIRISGDGENLMHLGHLRDRRDDLVDIPVTSEPKLGKRVYCRTNLCLVEQNRVSGDHAQSLKAIDPALDGRGGQVDALGDIRDGPTAVLAEERDDLAVDLVNRDGRANRFTLHRLWSYAQERCAP